MMWVEALRIEKFTRCFSFHIAYADLAVKGTLWNNKLPVAQAA